MGTFFVSLYNAPKEPASKDRYVVMFKETYKNAVIVGKVRDTREEANEDLKDFKAKNEKKTLKAAQFPRMGASKKK